MKLSILMPVYNEEKTINKILSRVFAVDYGFEEFEVIAVDDKSKDNSLSLLREFAKTHPELKVIAHKRNGGKGVAMRSAFKVVTGDVVIVQDADLEYDPAEIPSLVRLIRDDIADVVYGSRFLSMGAHRVLYNIHYIANRALTMYSNLLTGINFSDMNACYKAFRWETIKSIRIEENRFGFDPEITAKVSHRNWRIYEVPISYYGRTYEEGKKIGWRDGFRSIWCITKYNLFR